MAFWNKNKNDENIKKKSDDPYFFDLIQTVNWIEIPALDFERAINFYKSVFNCGEFEYHEFNKTEYAFFKSNSNSLKGTLVKVDAPITNNGPRLYFNVDTSLSKVLLQVENFGGKIIQPKSLIKNSIDGKSSIIPVSAIDNRIGYLTIIEDSEGNRLMLHSNS